MSGPTPCRVYVTSGKMVHVYMCVCSSLPPLTSLPLFLLPTTFLLLFLPASHLPSLSVNKRDSRGVFLYVVSNYSDDFHIFFSSEAQCGKYALLPTSPLPSHLSPSPHHLSPFPSLPFPHSDSPPPPSLPRLPQSLLSPSFPLSLSTPSFLLHLTPPSLPSLTIPFTRFYELVTSALSADSTHSHTLTELTDQVTEYEYETDEKTGQIPEHIGHILNTHVHVSYMIKNHNSLSYKQPYMGLYENHPVM